MRLLKRLISVTSSHISRLPRTASVASGTPFVNNHFLSYIAKASSSFNRLLEFSSWAKSSSFKGQGLVILNYFFPEGVHLRLYFLGCLQLLLLSSNGLSGFSQFSDSSIQDFLGLVMSSLPVSLVGYLFILQPPVVRFEFIKGSNKDSQHVL
jgi:hypothetical protein